MIMRYKRTKRIQWGEYCPEMPKVMSVHEMIQRYVEKEDHARHAKINTHTIPKGMTYPKAEKGICCPDGSHWFKWTEKLSHTFYQLRP